ncbi:MAG: mandelate racemase/muconate lactonizing enzyme family protein [Alphaproteobacteria bacterium]
MKITDIKTIALEVPFNHRGGPKASGGRGWKVLSIVLVQVTTDTGIVGYGEAFSYGCRRAVQAVIEDTIAPFAIGQDASNIAGLSRDLQQKLHLFGRHGITIFGLSGLDLALWDIAGKAAGVPVHKLLGGPAHKRIEGYASLFRFADVDSVVDNCRKAVDEGFKYIKLHEITEPEVRAARETVGPDIAIMIDTNCPWTPAQARLAARWMKQYDPFWLEEPIFGPEDFRALARLRRESGIPIAIGENACTAYEFQAMFAAEAVDYAQPSVTKVGGITEFRKVATLAETQGVTVVPHSPYFGPGFLATLQLMAAQPVPGLIESYYVTPEATLYGSVIAPEGAAFKVPEGPGLGADPDPAIIEKYRVG